MKSNSNDEDSQSLYSLKLDLERINSDLQITTDAEEQKYLLLMKKYILQSITEKYQENCTHPVWYMINKDEQFGNTTMLTCQCLECSKIVTDQKNEFSGRILTGQDILKKFPGLTHVYEIGDSSKDMKNNRTRLFKKKSF